MTNKLYYGDNLDVLRDHIASDSIDLVYLDPPFKFPAGVGDAQIAPKRLGTIVEQIDFGVNFWSKEHCRA